MALAAGPAAGRAAAEGRLAGKLAQAFRIDVSKVDVSYDFRPRASRVDGRATLRFEMRPGRRRPAFYFNPLRHARAFERSLLTSLELDGERLDPRSNADLRRLRTAPGAEPAFEVQRRIAPDVGHTLRVAWSMPKPMPPRARPWFFANFDDTEGPNDETETLWPTDSSPDDLIRHRIELRVHSRRPYTVAGSGRVRRHGQAGGVQSWTIETQRRVPSHTVFFAAAPSDRVRVDRFSTGGVEVKIVSNRGRAAVARARSIAKREIARLVRDFGPFPMPRMQILLTRWNSGMEYYGATRTGLGSLEHELGHMYFGVSAINRTWRDTWFDESAVVWWEAHASLEPVGRGFRSAIGAGRPAAAPGFDESAYGAGARVLEAIARAMGGDREMTAFLADLYARRRFDPFTTRQVIDDVMAAQKRLGRPRLERWLLSSGSPGR